MPAERGLLNRFRRAPLLLTRPFPVAATYSKHLTEHLRTMTGDDAYDCVQFEHFHMGQYARTVPEGTPRILVLHDVAGDVLRQQVRIASGMRKCYYYRQWKLSRFWEKWYAIWCGSVFTMSLKDKRTVEAWDVGVRTHVMPPLLNNTLLHEKSGRRDPETILFVGAMHRPGNQDAVLRLKREIMPQVRKDCPEARCLIVGANPPARIRDLSSGNFIVTGAVDRIEPYLISASLLAVPLRVAGGIIGKIILAMTAGCPVVATRPANAGIGARDDEEILIADRATDFAAAVSRLLKAPEEARRIGEAGRKWVLKQYDTEKGRSQMEKAYLSIGKRIDNK